MRRAWIGLALGAALGACSSDAGSGDAAPAGFTDRQLLVDYADHVVVPTYARLAERAAALSAAVDALAAGPSADTLAAAQDAWRAARTPWEQSEAFLFGPVENDGFDPALDSWPLDQGELDAVLAGDDELTQAYVEALPQTQKGFHTTEYLLFGPEKSKQPGDFDARQLAYLQATVAEFERIAGSLAAAWTEPSGDRPSFRDVFTRAGEAGDGAYPSLDSAAQEVVAGMTGILDEVANGKIADPYDAHDPRLVESQFSFNSIDDFQDNVRGVRRVWLGLGPDDMTAAGRSLRAAVAALDADLADEVTREIDDAITAIGAIPPPFRSAITDASAAPAIEAAQAAVRKAHDTLEGRVKPLLIP
jgi:uncharacterized iron-regulated protein